MKQVVLLIVALWLIAPAMAQTKQSTKTTVKSTTSTASSTWHLEAGVFVAAPFQFLHLLNSFGVGIDGVALHPLNDKFSIGPRVSLGHFFGKDLGGIKSSSTNVLDLLAELRYSFPDNWVVGGDAGVGFAIKSGGTNTQVAENLYVGYQLTASSHPILVSLVANTTHTQKSLGIRGDIRF